MLLASGSGDLALIFDPHVRADIPPVKSVHRFVGDDFPFTAQYGGRRRGARCFLGDRSGTGGKFSLDPREFTDHLAFWKLRYLLGRFEILPQDIEDFRALLALEDI